MERVAVVGAGVSGLTCAVLFAERGYSTIILAEETGSKTTSRAAAAIWFPYDAEPANKVIGWALQTYEVLARLANDDHSGVSLIELRQFSRAGPIQIPGWAIPMMGGRVLSHGELRDSFAGGYALTVPLMDTNLYLDYLAHRFVRAGGKINRSICYERLEDVGSEFDLVINCSGIGARSLVGDVSLEPHRGQVASVPKIRDLSCAIVCDDAPLMYAIPRRSDCVFGGTNELSDALKINPESTSQIVAECSRVLGIKPPQVVAERVGLRPFRKAGVRLESGRLNDGRTVIHNYGHGGSGFTLSWGCAAAVLDLGLSAPPGV